MAETERLSLTRDLYVPRELVFEVWTDADHLAQWHSPGPDFERTAWVDPRPGGEYRLSWSSANGVKHTQRGVYEMVQAPERLSYTATVEVDEQQIRSTRIDVRLTDLGGGTRIDLIETGYSDPDARQGGAYDWQRCLDQLEAYFSSI